MKLPRDLSGDDLAKKLEPLGYQITRQTGSHFRLTRTTPEDSHHITIPRHHSLRVGTLVTPDTALRLARFTGSEAEFWLNLQQAIDLWDALRSDEAVDIDEIEPATAS